MGVPSRPPFLVFLVGRDGSTSASPTRGRPERFEDDLDRGEHPDLPSCRGRPDLMSQDLAQMCGEVFCEGLEAIGVAIGYIGFI